MTSSRRASSPRREAVRFLAVCTLIGAASQAGFEGAAHAQRSAADIESARQLYNQGIELREKGDLKGALEKLRAAHALGNTPLTGIELCKTHASLAQPVEAREVCLGVGRIPPLAGETSRSQDARNEAARVAEEMKPRISIVRLRVTGVPQGREPIVTVDGAPVPAAALGEARAINPGKHDISARVGNGPETRSQVDLAPGETKEIALPVTAPAQDSSTPAVVQGPGQGYRGENPPPKERSNGLATAGFIVGGIGVGIGAVTGIVALSGKSDLDKKCAEKICGVEEHDALDSAKRWGNVSTTFFIIGGAGLLVGLIATLSAPRSSAQAPALPARRVARQPMTVTPDFGPGGVGLHGSF